MSKVAILLLVPVHPLVRELDELLFMLRFGELIRDIFCRSVGRWFPVNH